MTFVGSDLALRVYAGSKESGKPMPRFSDDDVIDFMVTEAVILRSLEHQEEMREAAEKKQRMAEWKRGAPGSGMPALNM